MSFCDEGDWPSVEDPEDTLPICPYCESREGEGHSETCPRYLPLCGCGRPARRAHDGIWVCTTCEGRSE
jgi:hypothetical protein